ncbi:MAG: hypothetical protein KGZ42_02290 [Melioribacter sp.]|nr:hypothetical protein [Melioribacter sp.]
MKKRFGLTGIKLLFILYTLFSLISLSNCTKNRDDYTTLDQINNNKAESIRLLSSKYNAEPFECSAIEKLVNKSVVIDTTVICIVKKENDNYIRAEIKSDCKVKYYAELLCNEQIIQEFNRTKSYSLLLVADIKGIAQQNYVINADSLSGEESHLGSEKVYLLFGYCRALSENESDYNAD